MFESLASGASLALFDSFESELVRCGAWPERPLVGEGGMLCVGRSAPDGFNDTPAMVEFRSLESSSSSSNKASTDVNGYIKQSLLQIDKLKNIKLG